MCPQLTYVKAARRTLVKLALKLVSDLHTWGYKSHSLRSNTLETNVLGNDLRVAVAMADVVC